MQERNIFNFCYGARVTYGIDKSGYCLKNAYNVRKVDNIKVENTQSAVQGCVCNDDNKETIENTLMESKVANNATCSNSDSMILILDPNSKRIRKDKLYTIDEIYLAGPHGSPNSDLGDFEVYYSTDDGAKYDPEHSSWIKCCSGNLNGKSNKLTCFNLDFEITFKYIKLILKRNVQLYVGLSAIKAYEKYPDELAHITCFEIDLEEYYDASKLFRYTSMSGIRFYDKDNNMITFGDLIDTGMSASSFIDCFEKAICKATSSYGTSSYNVGYLFNTNISQTAGYPNSYWLTEERENQKIKLFFYEEISDISRIEFVPVPDPSYGERGIAYPISFRIYTSDGRCISQKVEPIKTAGAIQSIDTPDFILTSPEISLLLEKRNYTEDELLEINCTITDTVDITSVNITINDEEIKVDNSSLNNFDISISYDEFKAGFNKISITASNTYNSPSNKVLDIFKHINGIVVFDKAVITNKIELDDKYSKFIISTQHSGEFLNTGFSIDDGDTWNIGETDIVLPRTTPKDDNYVKLIFLMSKDVELKAYGVGWIK